jgi:hypothetical protein
MAANVVEALVPSAHALLRDEHGLIAFRRLTQTPLHLFRFEPDNFALPGPIICMLN